MANETTPKDTAKKVKIELVKYAYGAYRLIEPAGSKVMVDKELAEKMVESGHAKIL